MIDETPPHHDREMRQRLVRGEESALGELYDRYASLVHGLAHRFLGDEEAANRVMGEVFAQAWQNPRAYEPTRGPLRSWLAGLTHRQALRHLCERTPGGEPYARLEERVRAAARACAEAPAWDADGRPATARAHTAIGREHLHVAAARKRVGERSRGHVPKSPNRCAGRV